MNPTKPLNAKTDWSREMSDEFKDLESLREEQLIDYIYSLRKKLKIATEALEEIGINYYSRCGCCDGGESKYEIAREALEKLKKETET